MPKKENNRVKIATSIIKKFKIGYPKSYPIK